MTIFILGAVLNCEAILTLKAVKGLYKRRIKGWWDDDDDWKMTDAQNRDIRLLCLQLLDGCVVSSRHVVE
jgi:hypothetical protein